MKRKLTCSVNQFHCKYQPLCLIFVGEMPGGFYIAAPITLKSQEKQN